MVSYLVALIAGAALSVPAAVSAAPVRVLPVGDSITQGSAGDYTWRYRLWQSLQTGGPSAGVDFVGDRNTLWNPLTGKQDNNRFYADPSFDQDHHALWLRTLIDESKTIGAAINGLAAKPDVIVVDLGTNDYARGAANSMTALKAFVANARAAAPGVDVVVLGLYRLYNVKTRTYANVSYVSGFNSLLPSTAAALDTPSERVVAAPVEPTFDAAKLTWDGRHPTSQGELVLAKAAADGLRAVGVGSGWNGPDTASWPATLPAPTLVPASNGTIRVTWSNTQTPGALAWRLQYRDVTAGGPWILIGTPPAGTTAHTQNGLKIGSTYAFRISPVRGEMEGQPSTEVSATIPQPAPAPKKPWWQFW